MYSLTPTRRTILRSIPCVAAATGLASSTVAAQSNPSSNDIRREFTVDSGGRAEVIEPDAESDFNVPYVLFRPDISSIESGAERPLYVKPHNDTAAADRDELLRQGTSYPSRIDGNSFDPAKQHGMPGLLPLFPRTPDDGGDFIQSMALPSYRTDEYHADPLQRVSTDAFPAEDLKRVDKQLLAMLDDATEQLRDEPYSVADEIHMNGFSASSSFSARFAFLYPDRVNALSLGGNGSYPWPVPEHDGVTMPYPLGTSDYEELTGREFDVEEWSDIHQYIFVGENDEPWKKGDDRGYYPVAYRYEDRTLETMGRERVTERFARLEKQYDAAGSRSEFTIVPDVGHHVTRSTYREIVSFHGRVMGGDVRDSPGAQSSSGDGDSDVKSGDGTGVESGGDGSSGVGGAGGESQSDSEGSASIVSWLQELL